MKYLHTMVRVHDLEASLGFDRDLLGLVETDRYESEEGQFTLVFLAAPEDLEQVKAERAPLVELTYNWDGEEYHGCLLYTFSEPTRPPLLSRMPSSA